MDRRARKQQLAFALAFLALSATAVAGAAGPQQGQWAQQGTKPAIRSQLLAATSASATTVDITQYRQNANALILKYTAEQTKLMHLIQVRDDFREFVHLHPTLHAGHFTIPVALASGHRYYIFADSTPAGLPQQVFRYILGAGSQPRTQDTALSASHPSALVGPYSVQLSATRVRANTPLTLYANIHRNGKPATDLRPYLGAAAHIVLINTSTLTYAHIHPTDAGMAPMPDMQMSARPSSRIPMQLPPLSPHAAYKLWIQFQGGSTVYVAPFTLVTR